MRLIYKAQRSKKIKSAMLVAICVCLFLYIFSIPSFGESNSKYGFLVYLSMIMLLLFVVIYNFLYEHFLLKRVVCLIPLFAVHSLVGTVIFSNDYRRWLSLPILAISFITFIYAFRIVKKKTAILSIVSLAFFCFSLLFVICYKQYLIHFGRFITGYYRLGKTFDNPNGVAAFEVVGFAAPLYIVLFGRKKLRFLYLIPVILSLVVGLSTGSRTFLVALLIFVIIYLYFLLKNHKVIYIITVISIFALLIGIMQLPFMASFKERIIEVFDTVFGTGNKIDTSTLERIVWAEYGFSLGLKNGLFGYGANGFSIYSGVGTYSHNNYSEVICNFGIIGLILFYFPLILLLLSALKNKRVDKVIVVSFVVYYLVVSLSNVLYYKKIYYLVLSLLFYLVYFENVNLNKNKNLSKNIVFTCEAMFAGGAERVISLLSNELSNKGYNVTIVGVSDRTNNGSFYQLVDKVKYIPLCQGDKKKKNPLIKTIRLRKELKSKKPYVVISFLPHINVYTTFALMFTNILHVVSERNDPSTNPKNNVLRILKRISFVSADWCVFQTKEAQLFYKDSVVEKSSIILNPCSLETRQIDKPKQKIVFTVGRLVNQKNHKLLIKAFCNANRHLNNNYKLLIFGEGPLKEELNKYCIKLGLENYVTFAGEDSCWKEKALSYSLFVLSSDYEGMPNSLIEALSMGINCVSTDCSIGGPRLLKSIGFDFDLVPCGDELELTNKIVEALTNRNTSALNFNNMEKSLLLSPAIISDEWIKYIYNLK